MNGYNIILASSSPRRKELLAGCDIDFTVDNDFNVEETYPSDMDAENVPLFLANLKSEAYPRALGENDILLTADTVVILQDEILGKPKDREEAIEFLTRLSGCWHKVVTGVVLRGADKKVEFSTASTVWFKNLSFEQIEYYVDKYKPFDKAGGYGIQEWIGYVGISRIEGSFYNVMGLPTRVLCEQLEKFCER